MPLKPRITVPKGRKDRKHKKRGQNTTVNEATKLAFLKEDLRDSLRWLFVGAVAWHAAKTSQERCPNQDVLGMSTSLVQARALYEFFYGGTRGSDDARARDFAPDWTGNGSDNVTYWNYMASERPANKRVFHLVYNRSTHSGGKGHEGPDHLKNQVLAFAKDLRRLTEEFVMRVEPLFRHNAKLALSKALDEAEQAAKSFGIDNPFNPQLLPEDQN